MIPLLDKTPKSKKRWTKAIFNLLALQSPADMSNSAMNTPFESVPLSESVEQIQFDSRFICSVFVKSKHRDS